MSLYFKHLPEKEMCTLLERLDMSKDQDFERGKELLKFVDLENFLLEPDYYERDVNDILYFLWDPENEKICGFMHISYLKDMEGVVDAITLQILTSRSSKDMNYKSERIGNILMDALFNEAKSDHRINFITIESVSFYWDAHKFYQKMGFQFVGKTKRPLMVIRKKPSFNRFLYLDGDYPESDGWSKEEMLAKLPETYDEINRTYDPEGKYTMFYKENEYGDLIYCKNFQKEGYNLMISYLYNKIAEKKVDDDLKNLLRNHNILWSLIELSIKQNDYQTYKKTLMIALEFYGGGRTLNISLDNLPFNKKEFMDLIFNVFPPNVTRLRTLIDVHISHPYHNMIDKLRERRFVTKNINDILDLDMYMLGLYYHTDKEIVEKVKYHIKNKDIRKEFIESLKG